MTVAPGITAPEGSATVPPTLVEFPAFWATGCFCERKQTKNEKQNSKQRFRKSHELSPCMNAAAAHLSAVAKNECGSPHAPRDRRRMLGDNYLFWEKAVKREELAGC